MIRAVVTYIDGTEETFERVSMRTDESCVRLTEENGYGRSWTTMIPLTSIRKVATS